jgi:hypothetical protein
MLVHSGVQSMGSQACACPAGTFSVWPGRQTLCKGLQDKTLHEAVKAQHLVQLKDLQPRTNHQTA